MKHKLADVIYGAKGSCLSVMAMSSRLQTSAISEYEGGRFKRIFSITSVGS